MTAANTAGHDAELDALKLQGGCGVRSVWWAGNILGEEPDVGSHARSIGCRCVRIEQLFALELTPEFNGNLGRQASSILLHFRDAKRSRDDRAYRRME